MASETWDGVGAGGPATDWNQVDLWVEAGVVPGNGDTATFTDVLIAMPDTNLPAAGTIGFTFTGAYSPLTVSTLLGGAAIGLITVNNAGAVITPGANFAGATITAGQLTIAANRTSSQAISVTGTLYINNATLAMAAGMNVAPQGTGTVQAAGAAPILDGGFLAAGNCTVDWASTLDIIGSFDAGGFAVTHSNIGAVGINQITCDIADKNLDLGSTHADLKKIVILIQAATVATSTVTAKIWQMTGGTYNDGGQAHNIDGDILDTAGVLTSTGVWTQTASGNVAGGNFHHLVLAQPTFTSTLTAAATCSRLTLAAGTLTGAQSLTVYPDIDNAIVQDATVPPSITNLKITVVKNGGATIAALNTSGGTTLLTFSSSGTKPGTMTGAINCGTNALWVYGSGAGLIHLLDMSGQILTVGAVTIGNTGATTAGGTLALGAVTNISGAVIGGNAANKANNTITIPAAGVMNLTGSINGTNIDTITAGAGVVIRGGGTITACDGDPGNIVRCLGMVDGGGNHANYVFSSARGARQTLIGVG